MPPTSFNSSSLVRLLSSVGPRGGASAANAASATAAPGDLAESLSQWFGWADAIDLSAALAAPPAPPAKPGAAAALPSNRALGLVQTVAQDCEKTRRELARTITGDVHALGSTADDSMRRSLSQALQRTMETRIGPLRARARVALASLSPAGARLAALDAVLERALAGRERQLLASVPQLLAPGAVPAATSTFTNDTLRQALLAELETRLQPLQGLVAASATHAAPATDAAQTTKARL